MNRQIIHIDLDAFFVSVEQALDPRLRGRPVVVGGNPDKRGVVASASYEARAFGIGAGMPLKKAHRLCPDAVFLEGSFHRYRDYSERFMGILSRFTPFLEPAGIDEAYLDLTGFEPLYGSTQDTALRIKRRVKDELGLTSSVGIATSKVVTKVASRIAKPDGLIEVPPGKEGAFLAPLDIAKLPSIGIKAEQRLREIGVITIGQLAALPPSFLEGIFGRWGEVIHSYANGVDGRRVEPPSPQRSISRETTFADDTLDRPLLRATLRYLSERVGCELRGEGRCARRITLKLRYADFETITRSQTLGQASDLDQVIFWVGAEMMERALDQRRQLVRLIGIGVSSLNEGARQLNMFDPSLQSLGCLDGAIDRIRKSYGFVSIQTGRTFTLRDFFATKSSNYHPQDPSSMAGCPQKYPSQPPRVS